MIFSAGSQRQKWRAISSSSRLAERVVRLRATRTPRRPAGTAAACRTGRPSTRLARRPDDVPDAGRDGGTLRTRCRSTATLLAKVAALGARPGAGIAARWTTRVDTVIAVVDAGQRTQDLAVVGQVDARERRRSSPEARRRRAPRLRSRAPAGRSPPLSPACRSRRSPRCASYVRLPGRVSPAVRRSRHTVGRKPTAFPRLGPLMDDAKAEGFMKRREQGPLVSIPPADGPL